MLEWIAIQTGRNIALTRLALDLTAKDCKTFTFVGHVCAAVRFALENIAKTFTAIQTERSIAVTRPALELTAKDNTTFASIYAGHISAVVRFTLEVCRSFAAIQVF